MESPHTTPLGIPHPHIHLRSNHWESRTVQETASTPVWRIDLRRMCRHLCGRGRKIGFAGVRVCLPPTFVPLLYLACIPLPKGNFRHLSFQGRLRKHNPLFISALTMQMRGIFHLIGILENKFSYPYKGKILTVCNKMSAIWPWDNVFSAHPFAGIYGRK